MKTRLAWAAVGAVLILLSGIAYFASRNERPAAGASHGHAHGHDDEHTGESHGEPVLVLDEAAQKANGITLAIAGEGTLRVGIDLPGEVVLNEERLTHVVPRFPGIVERVTATLGDRVNAGDLLAVVQSNMSVAPYEIRSPLQGTIIRKHVTAGEFVRDDHDLFVIADLTTVWVNVSVYSRYLPRVKKGLPVEIHSPGVDTPALARIDYVGPIIGESTRTAIARVVLPNREGQWQPGLFVTARVLVDELRAPIVVPESAIQTVESVPTVFVMTKGGFMARHIETGASDGRHREVQSGLGKGETYAATGTFILKAELGKSEATHDH